MTDINHLPGITSQFFDTDRLGMHVLTAGMSDNPPILFLHGNTSSSTIWEEFMLGFADNYFCIAPDLRGFGKTQDKLIDATRGIQDWVDDLAALMDTLRLDSFHLVGHSLGGFVCWGLIAQHAQRIQTASLIAPGPPMGFGGIHGKKGIANNENYSGSGGGIVVNKFADRVMANDRSTEDPMYSPRNVMNRLFWKNGFRADREDDILSAMLSIHTGEKRYPGDYVSSDFWPGVAPGKFGPVNAISPKYNRFLLQNFLHANRKPPLLWIHGKDDKIIADKSFSDPGYQGKMELREGWPGEDIYPPQPMLSQISYALESYSSVGGMVINKRIADCGHTPFIEKPGQSKAAVQSLLNRNNKKFH
jgi:pimeloyl-ACP methyl ester carboxylesterase